MATIYHHSLGLVALEHGALLQVRLLELLVGRLHAPVPLDLPERLALLPPTHGEVLRSLGVLPRQELQLARDLVFVIGFIID